MKSIRSIQMTNLAKTYCVLFVFFIGYQALKAENKPFSQLQDTAINVFSGVITGGKGDKMTYAALSVETTKISTVTTADGEFLLKVPKSEMD